MRRHLVSHRVLPYRMPAKRQGTLDAWLVMVAHQTDAVETFYRLYGPCRRGQTQRTVCCPD
jgi:hypothetical protein